MYKADAAQRMQEIRKLDDLISVMRDCEVLDAEVLVADARRRMH